MTLAYRIAGRKLTNEDNLFKMHVHLLTLLLTYSYNLAMFQFIHSQALIVQDGPLASLFGVSWSHTHIQTHGRTPLDE
jgi:hypothetical protein